MRFWVSLAVLVICAVSAMANTVDESVSECLIRGIHKALKNHSDRLRKLERRDFTDQGQYRKLEIRVKELEKTIHKMYGSEKTQKEQNMPLVIDCNQLTQSRYAMEGVIDVIPWNSLKKNAY